MGTSSKRLLAYACYRMLLYHHTRSEPTVANDSGVGTVDPLHTYVMAKLPPHHGVETDEEFKLFLSNRKARSSYGEKTYSTVE